MLETSAYLWTCRLTALAVLIQTFEFFMIRNSFSENGVWKWNLLRQDFAKAPAVFQKALDIVMGYRGFLVILILRFLAALLLLFQPGLAVVLVLFVSTVFICLRWRGAFNGGSDAMTLVLLTALCIANLFPGNPNSLKASLWYIALQSTLSYFLAGLVKVKNSDWRNGCALRDILESYSSINVDRASWILKPASWFVLFFECTFPVIFLKPQLAVIYIIAAGLFHFANIFVFGLNRFFWVWIATYPALYFCSSLFNL